MEEQRRETDNPFQPISLDERLSRPVSKPHTPRAPMMMRPGQLYGRTPFYQPAVMNSPMPPQPAAKAEPLLNEQPFVPPESWTQPEPHLRIAPVPGLGPCGIGMLRRLRHGTGHRVLPRKITNPAFRSQLINPACKVGPLKSGLAVLLRMEMARMFARHLRAAGSLPPLSSPRTLYPYMPGPMAGKR